MRDFPIIFSIFVIEILTTAAEDFCRHPLDFKNELKTCHPNDFCLSLDEDRIHTKFFSTKTAYRAERSRDERPDFQIQGKKKNTRKKYSLLTHSYLIEMIFLKIVLLRIFGF